MQSHAPLGDAMERVYYISLTRRSKLYTVIHLLVVDVWCVLFWTQSACMAPQQNTRNLYHKQMNNGVQPGET